MSSSLLRLLVCLMTAITYQTIYGKNPSETDFQPLIMRQQIQFYNDVPTEKLFDADSIFSWTACFGRKDVTLFNPVTTRQIDSVILIEYFTGISSEKVDESMDSLGYRRMSSYEMLWYDYTYKEYSRMLIGRDGTSLALLANSSGLRFCENIEDVPPIVISGNTFLVNGVPFEKIYFVGIKKTLKLE